MDSVKATYHILKEKLTGKGPANAIYVTGAPDFQHLVDLFDGEWTSKFPAPLDSLKAGQAELFNDARLNWGIQKLGGVKDLQVLELGPLEGGHTFQLHGAGAASITAVEANKAAVLRCLVVKEIFQLNRARFLLGDFVKFLETGPRYDVCVASGVLYHTTDPLRVLDMICRSANKIFLWTHYYDKNFIDRLDPFRKFIKIKREMYDGEEYRLYRYNYRGSLSWKGFCGGIYSHAYWLSREDILKRLRKNGFKGISVLDQEGGDMPAFAVTALRGY